jgi:hypothetical protein
MKINISYLERHELPASRERFVSYAKHRPLTISAKTLAGGADELLYIVQQSG